jgi:hypothetical protein
MLGDEAYQKVLQFDSASEAGDIVMIVEAWAKMPD